MLQLEIGFRYDPPPSMPAGDIAEILLGDRRRKLGPDQRVDLQLGLDFLKLVKEGDGIVRRVFKEHVFNPDGRAIGASVIFDDLAKATFSMAEFKRLKPSLTTRGELLDITERVLKSRLREPGWVVTKKEIQLVEIMFDKLSNLLYKITLH